MKKRMLAWTDTPTCNTGFGNVAKNVLRMFHSTNEYDIDVIGINHTGYPYDQKEFPYMIYPALVPMNSRYNDPIGRLYFLDMLATGKYDIVWIQNDTFNLIPIMKDINRIWKELPINKKFVIIFYFPIDSEFSHKEWITKVVSQVDFPVCYTEFGKGVCVKHDPTLEKMDVIHLGVDPTVYKQDAPEFIKDFKIMKYRYKDGTEHIADLNDKYVLLNVNRNQIRKDYMRSFALLKTLKEDYSMDNVFLFCLCSLKEQGGDIRYIADYMGLEFGKDWLSPVQINPAYGLPFEIVNHIYNMSNIVISTSTGEGFGLSTIEAMACKRPIIVPRHTSFIEIVGSAGERGYFAETGGSHGDYVFFGEMDNNLIRPTVDVNYMAQVVYHIATADKKFMDDKIEKAYTWAMDHDWNVLKRDWMSLLNRAEERLLKMRK